MCDYLHNSRPAQEQRATTLHVLEQVVTRHGSTRCSICFVSLQHIQTGFNAVYSSALAKGLQQLTECLQN
jgi:hypothetical protein